MSNIGPKGKRHAESNKGETEQVEPKDSELVQRYYTVMEFLGDELAEKVTSYFDYTSETEKREIKDELKREKWQAKFDELSKDPKAQQAFVESYAQKEAAKAKKILNRATKNEKRVAAGRATIEAEQKQLGLPKPVKPHHVKHHGYLVSKQERKDLITFFTEPANKQKLIAKDAPYSNGKKSSHKVFQDENNNIWIVHHAKGPKKGLIGKGSFGEAAAIQCIYSPNHNVELKKFYVAKMQTTAEDNTVDTIKKEITKNVTLGRHLGELVVDEWVKKEDATLKKKQSAEVIRKPDLKLASPRLQGSQKSNASDSSVVHREPQDLTAAVELQNSASSVVIQESNKSNASVVIQESNKSNSSVVIQESNKSNSSVVHQDNLSSGSVQHLEHASNSFDFRDYEFAELKKQTLAEVAEQQPKEPLLLAPPENFKNVNLFAHLNRFVKMAAEVKNLHEAGILHLDIKAENFLELDGKITIIDFGLAKSKDELTLPLDPEHPEKGPRKLTPFEFQQGSPTNITPECFHEDVQDELGTQMDVYGLFRTFTLMMAKDLPEEAFKDGYPSPNAEFMLIYKPEELEKMKSLYHVDSRYNNEINHPLLNAYNQVFELWSEMRSIDFVKHPRPEIPAVQARLIAIEKQLKNKMNERQKLKVALGNLPRPATKEQVASAIEQYNSKKERKHPLPLRELKENEFNDIIQEAHQDKVGHVESILVGLALTDKAPTSDEITSAIKKYNKRLEQAWKEFPRGERGVKPNPLQVSLNEFNDIVHKIRSEDPLPPLPPQPNEPLPDEPKAAKVQEKKKREPRLPPPNLAKVAYQHKAARPLIFTSAYTRPPTQPQNTPVQPKRVERKREFSAPSKDLLLSYGLKSRSPPKHDAKLPGQDPKPKSRPGPVK